MFPGSPVATIACTMASMGADASGNSGATGTRVVVGSATMLVDDEISVGVVAVTPADMLGGLFRASTALPLTMAIKLTARTADRNPLIRPLRRTGFSTNRYDNSDKASAMTRQTSPSWTDKVLPSAGTAMMRTGQCHKYAEYEREPNHWKGDNCKSTFGEYLVALPPYNRSAVAHVGSSAHGPGKVVASVNNATLAMITPNPIHANVARACRANVLPATGTTAKSAPMDNSKARV